MLCLAFLSPSSTSFLSSSASSSSPFPNLLRRMRLMELTSGGECRAVTGSSPAAPPRLSGRSGEPSPPSVPVSLGRCQSGLREGSRPLQSPQGFHGAQSRTGLQHGHRGSRESFFPQALVVGDKNPRPPHKYCSGSLCPPPRPANHAGSGSCSPSPASQLRVSGKPRALLREQPGGDGGEASGGGGKGDAVAI